MAIISQETWDKFTKEEKTDLQEWYKELIKQPETCIEGIDTLENLFGKGNLQPEAIAEKSVEPIKEYFDMQTQDIEWNKCTKQEQQNILEIYKNHPEWKDVINALENKFGEHNLQPKPKVRTWEDVKKLLPEDGFCVGNFEKYADNPKVILKCQATIKIAKLIELGYGGMVTEEEWRNTDMNKYCVYVSGGKLKYDGFNQWDTHFIAFRTPKQREEFMSYPENVELVKQYYMI